MRILEEVVFEVPSNTNILLFYQYIWQDKFLLVFFLKAYSHDFWKCRGKSFIIHKTFYPQRHHYISSSETHCFDLRSLIKSFDFKSKAINISGSIH